MGFFQADCAVEIMADHSVLNPSASDISQTVTSRRMAHNIFQFSFACSGPA